MSKHLAILVDIDGTLADCRHRRVYREDGFLDWHTFNGRMHMDEPNDWCIRLMAMMKLCYKVILVSGRDEKYRDVTLDWLKHHGIADWDELLMRPWDDERPDNEVKEEILKTKILPNYDVLFSVDDRKSVVEMWRKNGIVCLQCDEGNY